MIYKIIVISIVIVDFMKQTAEGYVCLFTIKNPSFPDYKSNEFKWL